MVRAIEFVLKQADNKAGDYTVEFESFDDSTAAAGKWDEAKCAENARTYVDDERSSGVIGTYNSGCAAIIIPILNEAPIAMVSPANTLSGLTHGRPGHRARRAGQVLPVRRAELRARRRVRRQPGQDRRPVHEGTLGVTKVYILDDKELYGKGVADAFEAAAKDGGLDGRRPRGLGQGRAELHGADDEDQGVRRRRHLHRRRVDEQRRPARQGQGRHRRRQQAP